MAGSVTKMTAQRQNQGLKNRGKLPERGPFCTACQLSGERQLEGIQTAKARASTKCASPRSTRPRCAGCRLRDEAKLEPLAIARRLGIGRALVYPVLDSKAGGSG